MLALNAVEAATHFVGRLPVWLKIVVLCGTYSFACFLSLVGIMWLDKARVLRYFGGDAGGSVGLLIVPSVVAYCGLGVLASAVAFLVRVTRRKVAEPFKK
jgi:hypothetical protein